MTKFFLTHSFCIFAIATALGQGGGSPMITDDPGTVERGVLELEVIFEFQKTMFEKEYQAPLIDLDYGLTDRLDFSFEFPYLIEKDPFETNKSIGFIEVGVKYRFYENEKKSIFFGIVPEVLIPLHENGEMEYLLEFLAEKAFSNFVVGASLGYLYMKEEQDYFGTSILAGFEVLRSLSLKGEIAFEASREDLSNNEGIANFGVTYELNERIEFNSSIGTGLFASDPDFKKTMISFLGIKILI